MKRLLFSILGLTSSIVGTSQEVIPHPIPCLTITPLSVVDLGSGVSANDCILSTGETVVFNSDQNYSMRAGESIQFNPNTIIQPSGGNLFHAYIQQEAMDLAWYYPNSSPGTVGQYEKLEIGVQFQDSIQHRIANFVSASSGAKLNPFNPEDIDLYAEFWIEVGGEWYGPKRVNAFYYEKFTREHASWANDSTQYNFRVRYAPEFLGMYRCKITADVEGYGALTASEFTFECVPSSNKGFVKVGENKRYFTLGNEPFFPVGHNLTGPQMNLGTNLPAPPNHYVTFFDRMKHLKASGANYFRYITSPWQTEIEYEHLGDYSNRMTNAWEFDNILDTCKALDLKMHWNMAVHFTFEKPNGYGFVYWDWSAAGDENNTPITPWDIEEGCFRDIDSGYCYRSDLGIIEPEDFFSHDVALKHYKNRVRYMVARWGYSTSVAVMELMSEASHVGGKIELEFIDGYGCKSVAGTLHRPYEEKPGFPEVVCSWHISLASYIKDSLQAKNHLISVSYAGEPSIDNADLSYYIDQVDINTYNHYAPSLTNAAQTSETVTGKYQTSGSGYYADKPFMHSEYGTGTATYLCDGNSGYIRRLFLTPFTGIAGNAMTWDSHYDEQGAWHYMQNLNDFMTGIPLDANNWRAGEVMVQDDQSVEVFHLRQEEDGADSRIVGAIANRTYNYWTQGSEGACVDSMFLPEVDLYYSVFNFANSDLENDFKFENLGSNNSFKIDWYNPLTGMFIETTTQSSNVFGNLSLEFPGVLTGDATSPILLFKLYPSDGTFLAPVIADNNQMNLPQGFVKDDETTSITYTNWAINSNNAAVAVNVSPNPTSGMVNVVISGVDVGSSFSLVNQNGQIMREEIISTKQFQIDLSAYSNGLYYLIVKTDDTEVLTQIIKQ